VSPANNKFVVPTEGPSLTSEPSVQRNSKRSTYTKQKIKKNSRPGTADSDLLLVPKTQETTTADDAVNYSNIYNSYQYSLNSLQDILAWVRTVAIFI
jgi:hypothetical protein